MFAGKEKKKKNNRGKVKLIPRLVPAARAHPAADGHPAKHSPLRPACGRAPRSPLARLMGTRRRKSRLHSFAQRSRKGTQQPAWDRGDFLRGPGALGPGICRDPQKNGPGSGTWSSAAVSDLPARPPCCSLLLSLNWVVTVDIQWVSAPEQEQCQGQSPWPERFSPPSAVWAAPSPPSPPAWRAGGGPHPGPGSTVSPGRSCASRIPVGSARGGLGAGALLVVSGPCPAGTERPGPPRQQGARRLPTEVLGLSSRHLPASPAGNGAVPRAAEKGKVPLFLRDHLHEIS